MKRKTLKKLNITIGVVLTAITLLIIIDDTAIEDVTRNPYEAAPYSTNNIAYWIRDFDKEDFKEAIAHTEYLKQNIFESNDIFAVQELINESYRWLLLIQDKMINTKGYQSCELDISFLKVSLSDKEYWAPYDVLLTGVTSAEGVKSYLK